MENISTALREEAISLGLCKKWTEEWQDNTGTDALIDKFKRGLDFCIKHDWPTTEAIKRMFPTLDLVRNGVYVDQRLDFIDGNELHHGTYVLMGKCTGTLRFAPWTAATVYLRHDTHVSIEAGENAVIFVHLYDNSGLDGELPSDAKVRVLDRRGRKRIL